MRHFPQLSTLTAGQYPIRRIRRERVVKNERKDGGVSAYYDPEGAGVSWELNFHALTDGEKAALDTLFDECEGRLQTFLFLDPASNLLRWSEDYGQTAWTNGPLLSIVPAQPDPWGGTRASTIANPAGALQGLQQSANIPGTMRYCLSAYVRGNGAPFHLRIDSGGFVAEKSFTSNGTWMRYLVSAAPGGSADITTFSLLLPPGGLVDVTGVQAEAQPGAGAYRKTVNSCGIYPQARFEQDTILWQRNAPEDHSATIHIVSRPS
jgi:hypothetical protein